MQSQAVLLGYTVHWMFIVPFGRPDIALRYMPGWCMSVVFVYPPQKSQFVPLMFMPSWVHHEEL